MIASFWSLNWIKGQLVSVVFLPGPGPPLSRNMVPEFFIVLLAGKRSCFWIMKFPSMRPLLRKESKESKRSSNRSVRSTKSSRTLQCWFMSKELWLVSILPYLDFPVNLSYPKPHLLLYIYIFRWYWIQHWQLPCGNCTGQITTCKSSQDPKIEFISGKFSLFPLLFSIFMF